MNLREILSDFEYVRYDPVTDTYLAWTGLTTSEDGCMREIRYTIHDPSGARVASGVASFVEEHIGRVMGEAYRQLEIVLDEWRHQKLGRVPDCGCARCDQTQASTVRI